MNNALSYICCVNQLWLDYNAQTTLVNTFRQSPGLLG
jgi:hypothetical protein